jgi:uncharacterized protein (TIGR02452 family)
MERYMDDPNLQEVVLHSMMDQRFFAADMKMSEPKLRYHERAKIVVSGCRSVEAAEKYVREGKRVCVLNFASSATPGGGVLHGSSAQEEAICRTTTLYPCLDNDLMWESFYLPHRLKGDPLANNDCIYTPGVCVFKSDTDFPKPLSKDQWWSVNIITCAAPNLLSRHLHRSVSQAELRTLFRSRIRRIFDVAHAEQNEVLILGAFGCGAFGNDPHLVADAFFEVMRDYMFCFETIEFAIFHTDRETENYQAFYEKNEQNGASALR